MQNILKFKPDAIRRHIIFCLFALSVSFAYNDETIIILCVEQIWGSVLTSATKDKETIVHTRFRQKLSSSGLRRETERRQFLSKARVYYCFLVFRRIGEYISLNLFYCVNHTSRCSLIPPLRYVTPPTKK